MLPTPETYQVPVNERDTFHVLQRMKGFDPETGEPNPSFIQKYNPKDFELFMKRELERQGWELTILFDPRVVPAKPKVAPVRQAVPPQQPMQAPAYVQQPVPPQNIVK